MSETATPKFKRVLLKLSGEALAPNETKRRELAAVGEYPILDYDMLDRVAKVVKKCVEIGTQICIIVGAGNIWRGRQGTNMDRTRADHMGMLATTINALGLQDFFEQNGQELIWRNRGGTPVLPSGADNEVWSYGEEAYPILVKYMKRREALRD